MPKLTKVKGEKGITIIALVVTIVILLILAGISIALFTGDNGLIENASEAEIKAALAEVREQLDLYKIQGEGERIKAGDYSGEMSNEELIGTVYAQGFMGDTYRTVGIIKANGLKEELKCGTKLGKSEQEEDIQNQIDSGEITNLDNIYKLYDAFVVDFTDDTLYYVKNNQIWSIEGTKTEYTLADGNIVQSYPIEQIDQEYLEQRKFITEWTVEAGTQITLPINKTPNITIEWGADDNGDENLDTEKCTKARPTHTYTKAGTYTIKISGNMPNWTFNGAGDSKEYITKIIQWGNTNVEAINFYNCSNLTGNISSPNVDGLFANCTSVVNLFRKCSKLEGEIPEDLFASGKNIKNFDYVFCDCASLTGEIPENLFVNNTEANTFVATFKGCKGLTKIPVNLFYNCQKNANFGSEYEGVFENCLSITEIPAELFIKQTECINMGYAFSGCTGITSIPENLFENNTKIQSFIGTFRGTSIIKVPAGLFENTQEVINMARTFAECSKLVELEDGFKLPESVQIIGGQYEYFGIFAQTLLETTPIDFEIGENITDVRYAFAKCYNLSGSILIKANPSQYTGMFQNTGQNSTGITVNYTSNCTNIDDIIATNNTGTVIKGELIED